MVTLYGPNADSPKFFTNLKENLINWELSSQPIMLCGDWNVVLNCHNDTINYLKENNPNAQESVLELINTFELDDVYRDHRDGTRIFHSGSLYPHVWSNWGPKHFVWVPKSW